MVKTMKKVFSILTVLCMMMGILSITAFAAVSVTVNPKVESTSNPVPIGGSGSNENFFVAVKQAQAFSCWTAVDITGDTAAQGQIEAAVLAANNNGKGQDSDPWEFHYFEPSQLGSAFKVFTFSTDPQYDGTAVINYTNGQLMFTMDAGKWSHLLYGTYGSGPVIPQTGSLTITKTLGHDNAYTSAATDSEYSVDVTIASNTDDTKGQTYSLADSTASVTFDGTTNQVVLSGVKVDTPITITGLPAGQYTVAETSAPAPGGYTLSTSYTDSDTAEGTSTSDHVVNLTLGGTAAAPAISNGAITITNTYTASVIPPVTPQTGSLTITKTLGHDNAYTSAATDSEYSVDVTIASNTDDTKGQTYSLADSTASVTFDGTTNQVVLSGVKVDTPITITGLPAGQYTVAETSAPAPGRYTLSTSYTDSDTAEGTSTSDRVVTLSQVETDNGFAVSNGTMTITNTYTANGGGGGDDTPNNPGPGTTTPVEITDTTTPLGEVPAEPTEPATEPTEEIADEPVALASVPQTGDTSALWFTLSGLSAVGLAGVYVLGRKRRDDSIQ